MSDERNAQAPALLPITIADEARELADNAALEEIALSIERNYERAEESHRQFMIYAKDCGDGLIRAKASPGIKHGGWLPWLEERFGSKKIRTLQTYKYMAENWDRPEVQGALSDGTIENKEQCLRFIREMNAKKEINKGSTADEKPNQYEVRKAERKAMKRGILKEVDTCLDLLTFDELKALSWDMEGDAGLFDPKWFEKFGRPEGSRDCWEALLVKLHEIMTDPEHGDEEETLRDVEKWNELVRTKIAPRLNASYQKRLERMKRTKA